MLIASCNTKKVKCFKIFNFFPWNPFDPVAQSVERLIAMREAPGSTPGGNSQKLPKIIQCGGIFIYGFSEPLGIKYEGLASLLHWSELFNKFQFGLV